MNILLLGGGGFVGSNLAEHLLRTGAHDVVVVDVDGARLAGIAGPRLDVHLLDAREHVEQIAPLVAAADVAVNLVARTGPAASVRSPLQVIESTLHPGIGIADLCARHGTRLIQCSTCEVYGHPGDGAYVEDRSELRLGPVQKTRWTYAAVFQMLERILHANAQERGLEFTVLRLFNLLGPRYDHLVPAGTMGGPRLFAHFMSALLTGGPMYLVDGGHRRRTFTHIEDFTRAFDVVLNHPAARNAVLNVGNPANTCSVRVVADLMRGLYQELTGTPAACELVAVDGMTFYGEGYDDVDRAPPDVSRLRALGWEPRHDLRVTFHDAMRWHLDHVARADPRPAASRTPRTAGAEASSMRPRG